MTRSKISRLGFLVFLVADGMFFAGLLGSWLVLPDKEGMRRLLVDLYLAHLAIGLIWGGAAFFGRRTLDLVLLYMRFVFGIGFLLVLLLYGKAWF